MNTERMIGRAAAAQASKDSKALPKGAIRREKSHSESLRQYRPYGTGTYFCLHDKSYYEPCSKCRRSSKDARRNLENL